MRRIIFILLILAALPFHEAIAQDWSIIGVGSKGTLFYDPGRLTDLGGGKKKVWTKFVYNPQAGASLKARGERFAAAAYLTIPYEVNCLDRTAACQEGILYSRNDEPLGPFECSAERTKSPPIFPESVSEEALLDKVCP